MALPHPMGDLRHGVGQFQGPGAVAVDPAGLYVYVADYKLNTIQKFDSSGNFITGGMVPALMVPDGFCGGPLGIAVDSNGYVYAGDMGSIMAKPLIQSARVQKYTRSGRFTGTTWNCGYGISGLATDGANNVYVSAYESRAVYEFDDSGNYINSWSTFNGTCLSYPAQIACDSSGNVYVLDQYNNRVVEWNPSQAFSSTSGAAPAPAPAVVQ